MRDSTGGNRFRQLSKSRWTDVKTRHKNAFHCLGFEFPFVENCASSRRRQPNRTRPPPFPQPVSPVFDNNNNYRRRQLSPGPVGRNSTRKNTQPVFFPPRQQLPAVVCIFACNARSRLLYAGATVPLFIKSSTRGSCESVCECDGPTLTNTSYISAYP